MSIYRQAKKSGRSFYLTEEGKETPYQLTVKRLYAFPILKERILDNEEQLMELETLGLDALRHHDGSIVRMLRPGMRIDPEEAHNTQLAYLRGRIAADEMEVRQVQRALNNVCGAPYCAVVDCKYFQHMTDEETAEKLCCDPSTVRRNRLRLVRRIALRLYGKEAME